MTARVITDTDALDRLLELGLTVEVIERVVMRSEAEAATCTAFDPPTMAGFIRYGRSVRFLREELIPLGWDYDNSRNFCRTINPGREFAIVSTTGDAATGDPAVTPTTKNPKGYATVQAVDTNGQLSFDFYNENVDETPPSEEQLATWFLLYHVTDEEIRTEVSLPSAILAGSISDWQERIILPPFLLNPDPTEKQPGRTDDGDDEYVVEVNRR